MTGKHREVFVDPTPTGPIDVWPLLAADAPAEVLIDAQGNHHGKAGRFVTKADGIQSYRPTWAEVQTWVTGPDSNLPHVTVWDWPSNPDEEVTVEGAIISTKGAGRYEVEPPKRERPIIPDPAVIRAWAQKNGHPVSARGKLSRAVIDAYMAAR